MKSTIKLITLVFAFNTLIFAGNTAKNNTAILSVMGKPADNVHAQYNSFENLIAENDKKIIELSRTIDESVAFIIDKNSADNKKISGTDIMTKFCFNETPSKFKDDKKYSSNCNNIEKSQIAILGYRARVNSLTNLQATLKNTGNEIVNDHVKDGQPFKSNLLIASSPLIPNFSSLGFNNKAIENGLKKWILPLKCKNVYGWDTDERYYYNSIGGAEFDDKENLNEKKTLVGLDKLNREIDDAFKVNGKFICNAGEIKKIKLADYYDIEFDCTLNIGKYTNPKGESYVRLGDIRSSTYYDKDFLKFLREKKSIPYPSAWAYAVAGWNPVIECQNPIYGVGQGKTLEEYQELLRKLELLGAE